LESANPDLRLIQALLKLLGAIPELRVVVDHLPNANVSPADRRAYDSALRELASHPLCYAKLAEIPQKRAHAIPDAVVNHKISVITDRDYYNGRLDALWGLFGNERCFFGSDWPNSDALMGYSETFELVAQCADRHPLNAQQKFFYDNAFNAYSLRLAR
jgi:L-fuconolactonase